MAEARTQHTRSAEIDYEANSVVHVSFSFDLILKELIALIILILFVF